MSVEVDHCGGVNLYSAQQLTRDDGAVVYRAKNYVYSYVPTPVKGGKSARGIELAKVSGARALHAKHTAKTFDSKPLRGQKLTKASNRRVKPLRGPKVATIYKKSQLPRSL
jgi:hypothetical protein